MNPNYRILIKPSRFEILKISGSTHSFPTHIHQCYCVGRIDQGEKILVMPGRRHILKENDRFIIPPGTPHSCLVPDPQGVGYTVLCIKDPASISETNLISTIPPSFDRVDTIRSLYRYALSYFRQVHSDEDIMIRRLIRHIDRHLDEDLPIDGLAQTAGLNPFHLSHIFKHKTGLSIRQYIIQARIRKIRHRYSHRNTELTEAALDYGFYDQSHFIRHFKKHVGITPGLYQNSITLLP